MKKLFAVFLSLQFILSPLAFAQQTSAQEVGLNDAYLNRGTGSKGGYDFYFKQISSLGTAAIGSSILTQCLEGFKVPSISTFMGGTLAQITSEIVGAKSKNDLNLKKLKDLEIKLEELKTSGDVAQLEALKAALQEEKDNLDYIVNRKAWMIAVNIIYTAAVGLAVLEEFEQITASATTGSTMCGTLSATYASTTCSASCAAATIGYAACEATCIPAQTAAHLTACEAVMPSGYIASEALVAHSTARIRLTALCAGANLYYKACMTYAETALALVYGACQPAPVDGGASMLSWNTLLAAGYGFGTSQIGKDGKVGQYGTLLISLLGAFMPPAIKLVENAFNFPIPRSITFGALDILSIGVTTGLVAREEKANENIAKLTTAINQFKIETSGDESGVSAVNGNQGDSNEFKDAKMKTYEVQKLAAGQVKKSCISNSGGRWDISSQACASPVKIPKSNYRNVNYPAISNVSSLTAEMAQSLANGDQAGAYKIAGQIGAYAAQVKKETESLKTKLNEVLKKKNRPTVNFDQGIKERVSSLQQAFDKAAAANNVNIASLPSPVGRDTNSQSEKGASGALVAVPHIPAIDPMAGLGLQNNESQSAEVPSAEKASQSLDDFESPIQDISKKSDVSIFKQLSNRYILNYVKIFEAKKAPESVPVEKKN